MFPMRVGRTIEAHRLSRPEAAMALRKVRSTCIKVDALRGITLCTTANVSTTAVAVERCKRFAAEQRARDAEERALDVPTTRHC